LELRWGGLEWRRRLFVWDEELWRECSELLSNIALQDGVSDYWE